MAVTILEALHNARYNLQTSVKTNFYQLVPLAIEQLNNGVELLDKGYPLDTLVEPLLERYGNVENVPSFLPVVTMSPDVETKITMYDKDKQRAGLILGKWESNEPEEGAFV